MFTSKPKNVRVPVNLSPELHRQLQTLATKQSGSISTVIKQQIEACLSLPDSTSQTSSLSSIQDLLTGILKKTIWSNALLDHFLGQHATMQDMAGLEKSCEDEFLKLIGRLKD